MMLDILKSKLILEVKGTSIHIIIVPTSFIKVLFNYKYNLKKKKYFMYIKNCENISITLCVTNIF